MKRALSSWLSMVALMATGAAGTYLVCPGCVDPRRWAILLWLVSPLGHVGPFRSRR